MPEQCANEGSNRTREEQPRSHIPENLTKEQRLIVIKELVEEAESFLKTDDDVGRAEEFQRRYTIIPRRLYADVKHYVEDLFNREWIQKEKAAYSSPVGGVRKKMGH